MGEKLSGQLALLRAKVDTHKAQTHSLADSQTDQQKDVCSHSSADRQEDSAGKRDGQSDEQAGRQACRHTDR